jgi:hypothetical protein
MFKPTERLVFLVDTCAISVARVLAYRSTLRATRRRPRWVSAKTTQSLAFGSKRFLSWGWVGLGGVVFGVVGCAPAAVLQEEPFFPMLPLPGGCASVVERLEHLDQPSPLGFSAVEVLARVSGDSASPLVWLPPAQSSAYELDYGPERGLSDVRLHVAAAEGDVLYHREVPAPGAAEDLECAAPVLEVPVQVTIQSSGQALNESFRTVLRASTPYRAEFTQTLDPSSLGGGFMFTNLSSLDPERRFSAGPLSLHVVLWEGGSQGSLQASIQSAYAKPSAELRPVLEPPGEPPSVAVWPSAQSCPEASSSLPSDARLLGFSVDDVLHSLGSSSQRELEWANGDTTELDLEFVTPASELCQAASETLDFDTLLRARTRDGRLDAELPVHVSAEGASGSIAQISIQTRTEPNGAAPPRAVRVRHLDLGSHDAVRVDLDAQFLPQSSSGSLTLSGIDRATESTGSEDTDSPGAPLDSARWSR